MEELVKLAQKDNDEAFSKLVMLYKDDLYRVAKARIGNKEDDILDVVQETISAYISIKKLRKASSFKSWIFRILINKCNEMFKKKKYYNEVSFEGNECENYINSLEEKIDIKNDYDSIMNTLDCDERTIILLYYVYGYNSKEISKILDIKANTIRSKISRTREKIINLDRKEYENEKRG